jgi:hypothetical protein
MNCCWIQNVALKITSIEVLDLALLNTTSFLFNHITQQSSVAPSKFWLLSFKLKPCNQEPNQLTKLVGLNSKSDMHSISNKAHKVTTKEQMLENLNRTTETTSIVIDGDGA